MKQLFILFLFSHCIAFAQEEVIKGKILNAENMQPLISANVYLEKTGVGSTTNQSGEFEFNTSYNPEDNLVISYIGYQTFKIELEEFFKLDNKVIVLSPKLIPSQTILVTGSIGTKGITPLSFSKINRKEIISDYNVQDIPQFLSSLPSTTFYSESGSTLGYIYLSIRGFDQRRISVSINGIPQNEPEDHNIYWLDFPDLLASTDMIQVQRGSGSGMIGYPAVGGSINLITSGFSNEKSLDISASLGSFNTRKYSLSYSSGLVNNKYSFYAKFSKMLSSGYRNKSWIDYNAFHLSAIRFDENITTQINVYGGPVSDGLAYTGLPKFAVNDKDLRKQNFSYWEADNNKITYSTERRPDEIENFSQPHFELLNEFNINPDMTFNSALFLILGTGFFDYDGSWSIYYDDYFRLRDNGFDSTIIPTNALIRAQVENTQYGWIPRFNWKHKNGEFITGAEIRIHKSLHWGSINYANNLPEGITKEYRYYQYRGAKDIFNFFVHESYNLTNQINLLGEVQLAYHNYRLYEEKYMKNDFSIAELYVNPKFGLNYKLTPQLNLYTSFARVTREPRLKDYYDAAESSGGETPQFERNANRSYDFTKPLVKPETMNDIELGASFSNKNFNISLNGFYMLFNDEIVKQGQVDRFGQPVTGNADETIHMGVEASINFKVSDMLELVLNGTYSKNYISKGITFIEYNNGAEDVIHALDLSNNRISGFPDFLSNIIMKFNYDGFYTSFAARYVGKFYSDNYDEKLGEYLQLYPGFADYSDNVNESYFTADLYLSYETKISAYFNSVKAFAQVNNIFDNLYSAYAIGKEFFPAAERNFLFGIQLGL